MSNALAGRRALVTGATGGLGRAIARGLHARGATVVATGRREDALEELGAELVDRVEPLVADLADREQVEALPARAGRVDVLVANAALPGSGRLESFSPAEIDRALDVNLRAPMQLARALAPAMVERGSGHLVFVSSLNGKLAAPGTSVYTATKYGLRGFAASLRADLRGSGVGVSAIFPSFVADAGMWADTDIELPRGVRLPMPADVATAVIEGIERDRGEVDVAPVGLRVAAGLAGVAPGLVASLGQRLGSAEVADRAASAQRSKR
ncbi:MAG: 3-oxoacyl-[acyl-carrier protein] reductase [uncultured Solirubrobacterales bacterium]|uniref:3-oxoacyl-[acyl-carrier protein] reductase n=1 Tax=uncultured Solirubrobacterales bacterium TaxID=768556 RepID=A0A6J4TD27_9ACTN|nr:MAG: 3-oxoacyl-[acyl-carrier protein] reductase [uncultured Solirubrobacterales bacterium]